MANVKSIYNSVRCGRLNNDSGKSYLVVSEGNAGMVFDLGNMLRPRHHALQPLLNPNRRQASSATSAELDLSLLA